MASGLIRVPFAIAALLAALVLIPARSGAQPVPPELTAPVNDFANVIGPDEEAQLDEIIRKLQAASGDVIVVATIDTFQPAADIRMYALEMFENHGRGIGQKGRDNGMLVLLAVNDRQVWSEVGYELESIITDGFAGQTSRQVMVPRFRQGDYGGGLVAGVSTFAQRIAEARNVTLDGVPLPQPVQTDNDGGGLPIVVVLFLVMLAINGIRRVMYALTGGRRGRRRRRWTSGVGPFGVGYGGWMGGGRHWGGGSGGFGGGFGGFGGGRSGGGGGGAGW